MLYLNVLVCCDEKTSRSGELYRISGVFLLRRSRVPVVSFYPRFILQNVPRGDWFCPKCKPKEKKPPAKKRRKFVEEEEEEEAMEVAEEEKSEDG